MKVYGVIDKGIEPTIKELNRKGYITTACCSGHNERTIDYAYIQFEFGGITPESLPQEWYWTEGGQQMEYAYKTGIGADRVKEIDKTMYVLYEWSKILPDTTF